MTNVYVIGSSGNTGVVSVNSPAAGQVPQWDGAKWVGANGGSTLTPTATKTGAYTAVAGDLVPVNAAGGAVTILLPNAPTDRTQVAVKLMSASSSTLVATVQTQGSDVFNVASGPTSATIGLQYQAELYQYQASTGIWFIIANDLPLSQTDTRYLKGSGTPADGLVATYDAASATYRPRGIFPGVRALGGQQLAYTRAQPPFQPSNTGVIQQQSRIRHVPLYATNAIRLVYVNWVTNQTNSLTNLASITVKAGWEDPYGGVLPVTFDGLRSVTIDPGGTVISDTIVIDDPGPTGANPFYYSRTLVTVASGKWPVLTMGANSTTALTGDSYDSSNSVSDTTLSAGAMGTVGVLSTGMYGPSAILADAPARHPQVFLYGDSIMAGTGDTNAGTGVLGYGARACYGAGLPYVQIGTPSEQAINTFPYVGTQAHVLGNYKPSWMGGCTHVVAQHGINDLAPSLGNKTLAAFQTIVIAYWQACANRGALVYAPTLGPNTTSTDSWATVGNQTANANDAARTSYNDWLRAGAPIDPTTHAADAIGTGGALLAGSVGHPLTAYFEAADAVESARNSGKWKAPSYTADGIHPTATGAVALAATVPTSSFTV